MLVRTLAVLLVASVLTGCIGATTSGDLVRTLDEPLPLLTGTDLDGRALSTEGYAGSVLVVNAWASWCDPCEEETPMLVRMAERYEPRGVRFLGINHTDQLAEAQRFVERFGVPYPSFSDQAGRFAAVLGYPGLPATYVVDRSGTMRFVVFDQIHEETLVRLLEEILTQPAPTSTP